MIALGIDPGWGGGLAVIGSAGGLLATAAMPGSPHEIVEWFLRYRGLANFAMIEEVKAMPTDGRSSAFKFGTNYGICLASLAAAAIPYATVTPAKWQRDMFGDRGKGLKGPDKKRFLKGEALRLFPRQTLTLKTCDAVLLAKYATTHKDRPDS